MKSFRNHWRAALVAMVVLASTLAMSAAQAADMFPKGAIDKAITDAYTKYKGLQEGKNADYIRRWRRSIPICSASPWSPRTARSTPRVISPPKSRSSPSPRCSRWHRSSTNRDRDAILKTIGVDATGMRFNSIVSIELSYKLGGGPEMNALVNPGAITATSMVTGATADAVWAKIIGTYNDYAGRELKVLQDVYKSESDSNQRNQAIGMLMYAYGYIKSNPQQAVDLYTRQCSVGVNVKDLAMMASTLAFGGKNPVTGKQVIDTAYVPKVLAVMATAGLYDDSGKWFFATGLPGKSGVGGGIIAVSPGKFGIAVISPPLDDAGNSIRAQRAIADISNALGGNPLASMAPAAKK